MTLPAAGILLGFPFKALRSCLSVVEIVTEADLVSGGFTLRLSVRAESRARLKMYGERPFHFLSLAASGCELGGEQEPRPEKTQKSGNCRLVSRLRATGRCLNRQILRSWWLRGERWAGRISNVDFEGESATGGTSVRKNK